MSHLIDGQTNVYVIARTLGHCSVDVGQLCTSTKINKFSKAKPFRYNAPNFASDSAQTAALVAAKYGFTGPVFTGKAALFSGTPANGAMNYNYERPNQYCRERDFLNYFHHAQPCFMQAVGRTFTIDLMPINPDPVLFYLLMNYTTNGSQGLLSNKAFSTESGIDRTNTAVKDPNDLPCNICIEDLTFADAQGSYNFNLLGQYAAYLGIVVDKGSGQESVRYVECFESTYPVEEQTTVHDEMYKVGTSSLTTDLPIGTYSAVACAKLNDGSFDYYLPVFSKRSFPAKFTLNCGGLSNYAIEYRGLGETATGNFMAELTGSSVDEVYLKIRFYNKRGRSLDVLVSGNIKICLQYTVQSVDLGGGTTSVEDERGENYITVDKTKDTVTFYYPNPSDVNSVSIQNNDYAEFVFKIVNPFQNDDTISGLARLAGSYVNITPKVKFKAGTSDFFPVKGNAGYPTFKYTKS
jgi:hypothetical protein